MGPVLLPAGVGAEDYQDRKWLKLNGPGTKTRPGSHLGNFVQINSSYNSFQTLEVTSEILNAEA